MFPEHCQVEEPELCAEFSWVCNNPFDDTVVPVDGRWPMARGRVFPVQHACQSVLHCPACDGRPWVPCPPWDLRLTGVPLDALVVLFSENHEIIRIDRESGSVRSIPIEGRMPGERYFAAFASAAGDPLDAFELTVEAREREVSPTAEWDGACTNRTTLRFARAADQPAE